MVNSAVPSAPESKADQNGGSDGEHRFYAVAESRLNSGHNLLVLLQDNRARRIVR
jgi:hypothetical protein